MHCCFKISTKRLIWSPLFRIEVCSQVWEQRRWCLLISSLLILSQAVLGVFLQWSVLTLYSQRWIIVRLLEPLSYTGLRIHSKKMIWTSSRVSEMRCPLVCFRSALLYAIYTSHLAKSCLILSHLCVSYRAMLHSAKWVVSSLKIHSCSKELRRRY